MGRRPRAGAAVRASPANSGDSPHDPRQGAPADTPGTGEPGAADSVAQPVRGSRHLSSGCGVPEPSLYHPRLLKDVRTWRLVRERADSCLFVLSSPLMDSKCLCSRFNPRGTAPLIPSTSQGHRQTLARRPCWPWGPETDKALGPAVRRGRGRGPTQSHRCLLVLPRGAGDWAGGEDPACARLARRVAPPRSRHVECHLCCLLSFTL